MTEKKGAYEHTPSGRITGYNINYDIERFSFVTPQSSLFEKMTDKVNAILNGIRGSRPYELEWADIIESYLELGVGDVPHFASQYVFGNFLVQRRSHEKENMQAMYIEIVDGLNEEIEKGRLPGGVE